MLVILAMTLVSCALSELNEWNEARERRAERGEKCYEYSSGYIHCEDKFGNKTY